MLTGGLTVKRGKETIITSVFLSKFPRRFVAEQICQSESIFRAFKSCKLLLLSFTLSWGNWPDAFLQMTTGAEKTSHVTWGKSEVAAFNGVMRPRVKKNSRVN